MKRALAIQLNFDVKTVRRAMAMITGDLPTDEEIEQRFFDREPAQFDVEKELGDPDALQMCAGFVALIISSEEEQEVKKSRFEQRVEELRREKNG